LSNRFVLAGLLAATICLPHAQATASGGELPVLAPYQMVRSLQLLQDRIADGDHAALPMQKKMIEMIDQRLGSATAEEFADRRNIRALMVYGMSGGNPRTLEAVAARLDLDSHDKALADGLIAYFRSDHGKAATILASLDPTTEKPELAGFLALIKGTIRSFDHPEDGLVLLDQARLLAPGSLVEEAALRRSITLAATIKDPARFLRASEQYVRRFLRSPYASHFADGFINGVVAMRDQLDMAEAEAIISAMNADQQTAIYLRVARKSAILGHSQLAAFASAKAEMVSGEEPGEPDPRAELYNALGAVTSESIDDVARRLAAIDRETLSQRDVRLLDAATEVVNGVLSPPMTLSDIEDEPVPPPAGEAAMGPRPADPSPGRLAAASVEPAPATAQDETHAAVSGEELPDPQTGDPKLAQTAGQSETGPAQPGHDIVGETRKKLQEIDMLLEGARK